MHFIVTVDHRKTGKSDSSSSHQFEWRTMNYLKILTLSPCKDVEFKKQDFPDIWTSVRTCLVHETIHAQLNVCHRIRLSKTKAAHFYLLIPIQFQSQPLKSNQAFFWWYGTMWYNYIYRDLYWSQYSDTKCWVNSNSHTILTPIFLLLYKSNCKANYL